MVIGISPSTAAAARTVCAGPPAGTIGRCRTRPSRARDSRNAARRRRRPPRARARAPLCPSDASSPRPASPVRRLRFFPDFTVSFILRPRAGAVALRTAEREHQFTPACGDGPTNRPPIQGSGVLQSPPACVISARSGSPRHGRGCSSGVEHNLAKVGVEGSNPFARSRFSHKHHTLRAVPRGRFLLAQLLPGVTAST